MSRFPLLLFFFSASSSSFIIIRTYFFDGIFTRRQIGEKSVQLFAVSKSTQGVPTSFGRFSKKSPKTKKSWKLDDFFGQILILLGFEISIQNLLGHHVVFTLTLFVTIFKPQQKQLEQLLFFNSCNFAQYKEEQSAFEVHNLHFRTLQT